MVFDIVAALRGLCALVMIVLVFPCALTGLFRSTSLFVFLSPPPVGVTTFRDRLFDVLTNRTLVYAALGATLAAPYFGGIVVLQRIFAARFNPLRRRIHSLIYSSFCRSKYDAARTLAAFSARLRDETDLEQSNAELLSVVRATMQPEHASLWLREPERDL